MPSAGFVRIENHAGSADNATLIYSGATARVIATGVTFDAILPPAAFPDTIEAVARGGSINFDVRTNDVDDAAATALGAQVTSTPGSTGELFGTITLEADGTFTYENTDTSTGAAFDFFTYFVTDGTVYPGTGIASGSFASVTVIVQPDTVALAKPQQGASCGADIVLVIDSSGSVDDAEYALAQSALTAFVDAFLVDVATPTQFAMVEFNTTAERRFDFSSDPAFIQGEINLPRQVTQEVGPTPAVLTNYDAGLRKTHETFTDTTSGERADRPNIVVFASDGVPTRLGHFVPDGAAAVVAVPPAGTGADPFMLGVLGEIPGMAR